jgi:hypothetical protein
MESSHSFTELVGMHHALGERDEILHIQQIRRNALTGEWHNRNFLSAEHELRQTEIFQGVWWGTGRLYCVCYIWMEKQTLKVVEGRSAISTQDVSQLVQRPPVHMYRVRQFNSRNGPMKAKLAYLRISGCCRLRNTLLIKLCTSWDYNITAGNSLENRFPEYLVVTSRCAGCQECQQIFGRSGHFFNSGKSQKLQGAKLGVWSIFVMDFLARNSRTHNASYAGA